MEGHFLPTNLLHIGLVDYDPAAEPAFAGLERHGTLLSMESVPMPTYRFDVWFVRNHTTAESASWRLGQRL